MRQALMPLPIYGLVQCKHVSKAPTCADLIKVTLNNV